MPINVSLRYRLPWRFVSTGSTLLFCHGDWRSMNIVSGAGVALTAGGTVAYFVGVTVSFPGRSFSVTAVMVGITLLAVGRSNPAEVTP